MMPIFFHAESHIWIATLFIANGLMLTWLLRRAFESFRTFTTSLESQLLSAFFISLGVNGVVLLVLDYISLEFAVAKWPLGILAAGLALSIYRFIVRPQKYQAFDFEISLSRIVLYGFVFVVLFYNGGMIEVMSDSWWHMSLANKIALESTYSPAAGHLTGLPTRYYPPLWHGNIALLKQLSGISIPVFWNSLTAWAGVFKVMAFYLFAFGLSKDRQLALLAAILFVLLPGVGVSYLRVSAWPSHIAYTAWYSMFYVFALLLDDLPNKNQSLKQSVVTFFLANLNKFITLLALSLLIFFTHKAEILWFAVAWLSYLICASLSRALSARSEYIAERDHAWLCYSYRAALLLLIGYGTWFASKQHYPSDVISDQLLANLLPLILLSLLLLLDFHFYSKTTLYGLFLLFCLLLLGSVNYTHLYSLFVPELALPKGLAYESSAVAVGYFGGELKVPTWHLQLRGGLLFSGILSILIALAALVLKPTRLTILTAGTGLVALLFCSSPYLYHWLQGILNYHSPWRISLIIFHPIVWAFALVTLNQLRVGFSKAAV